MEPKYKVGELVTIAKGHPVWYTHLDDLRLSFVGKTGRIVDIESQVFTAEDLKWFYFNYKDKIDPNYKQTIFNYYIIFPSEPNRKILFTEIYLTPFNLER